MEEKFLIGCHVKMTAPKYLLGSVCEAHNNGANCFMFYTGAPQNTIRSDIAKIKIPEMQAKYSELKMQGMVVHAPYIINLANTIKPEIAEFGVNFLVQEIKRVAKIGAKTIVLHPGSHVKGGLENGIAAIIANLNEVFAQTANLDVEIALETMSGKGSETCFEFAQIKYIIDHCKYPQKLGVCLDTCHIFDAGYDIVHDLDGVIEQFEQYDLLSKLKVIHLNDSKNILGSKKDRHENIGFGNIGFTTLNTIAHHKKFVNIPKILETPYIDKKISPYKQEIEMLKKQKFMENIFQV